MKAIILAGGLGTRLKPLTTTIPKPLLPIGDKPILEIILDKLKAANITDIILLVGYKSELIESYFGDGSKFGVKIEYVKEPKRLGTAGPLTLAKEHLKEHENFLLMNGDILTNLNFQDMIEYHNDHKADITVATVQKEMQTKYGVLEKEDHKVISLKEKPTFTFTVSAGIYILNQHALNTIPEDEYHDITDLMSKLIENDDLVAAYPIKEMWMAVDRLDDLEEAAKNIKKYISD